MSVLRTIVSSSRALATTAKDAARFREIASAFISHGFGWVVAQLKLRRELQVEADGADFTKIVLTSSDTGKRLVKVLTQLGPTWVKFGQILSTRPDIIPEAIIKELETLQDSVDSVPFEDIEGQLKRHLGEDWRDNFESVDEEPLASASIGQVHRAVLKDGSQVVLKVQRPGIRPKIESDLHILYVTAGYVEEAFQEAQAMDLQGMVMDFTKSISQELDYRAEATNMERFRRNFPDATQVRVPEVYEELCTDEVLTMEFVEGKNFKELLEEGGDTQPLVENYFNVAYQMLFIDGFFHGDLHPGNVLVREDNSLALLDCGMVGRLAPSRKDKVIDIIHAVIQEDLEALARTFYSLSIPAGKIDYSAFEADAIAIAERYLVGVPLSQIRIGELFSDLVQGAARHNVRMPTDFTMMFKAILTTEGLAKTIAPNVDPIELARPFITQVITERYSPDRMKQVALSDFRMISEMTRGLPHHLPVLLDGLQSGRIAFGVADDTLEKQAKSADLRVGRTIRASFAIAAFFCGTFVITIDALPILAWGIPWLSFAFWAIAAFWSFTLLRRGGLV